MIVAAYVQYDPPRDMTAVWVVACANSVLPLSLESCCRQMMSREPLFDASSLYPNFFPRPSIRCMREPEFAYQPGMDSGYKIYREPVSRDDLQIE